MIPGAHAVDETPLEAALRFTASVRSRGFALEALHLYADPDGTPVYWRIRARNGETGEKWIRPMKRSTSGDFVLGEPEFENGKPLYGLDLLADQPDAVVFIVEGEWCVDELRRLGLLATTSGSADSAASADWRVLEGRTVIVWRDNDAPGLRYQEEVVGRLSQVACSVQCVDVDGLALPNRGDAVDWIQAHPGATAEDVLALPVMDRPPARDGDAEAVVVAKTVPCVGGQIELRDSGVYFVQEGGEAKRICTRIEIAAMTRDQESGEWGRLLVWQDADGRVHRWAMPMELLQGDGTDVRRALARGGVTIDTSRAMRERLAKYLQDYPVEGRARCVDQLGWHGSVYVTPQEAMGGESELVVFQNAHAIEPAFAAAGSCAEWRDSVAKLACGNSRLVMAISTALAGPLAYLAGHDSGGFHFRGASSSGKSTTLRVASSVWGQPSAYMRTWRSTANGLEGLAAVHNDGVLILDELGQLDPRQAGEAAYLLANGQGKVRAGRSGNARPSHRWRVLFLSAGEESLTSLMANAGMAPTAGQELRLADIEADAGAGLGIFEELHGSTSGAAFALRLADATEHFYGAVGMNWLPVLVGGRDELAAAAARYCENFCREVVPDGASGQIERVARRFALVAFAGEKATEHGLTGWAAGEADTAVKSCFLAWINGYGGVEDLEERRIVSQVRRFLEAHGASRFQLIDPSGTKRMVLQRVGFVREVDERREYLVFPESFKSEVCRGLDYGRVKAVLKSRGLVKIDRESRIDTKTRLPGEKKSIRLVAFTDAIWQYEE